jgi:hypothetical protein
MEENHVPPEGHLEDPIENKDNPIVALEPEDNLKKGSAFLGTKSISQSQH